MNLLTLAPAIFGHALNVAGCLWGGLCRHFHFNFVNPLLQRVRVRRNFLGSLKPIDGLLPVAGFPFELGEVSGDFLKGELCFPLHLRDQVESFIPSI